MKLTFLLVASFALLLPAACGTSTSITLDGLDRSCKSASDCVGVHIGDVCECACPNAAINMSSLGDWNTEYTSIERSCTGGHLCKCPSPPTTCNAGTCALLAN